MTWTPPPWPQGNPPPGYPQPPYPQAGYPAPGYAPPGYGPAGYGGPGQGPGPGPRKYGIPRALVTFYLPDLWRDVGQRWKGIGLSYLFILLLLTWLPVFVKGYFGLAAFVRVEAPKITSQIPRMTIRNGVISIDRPEPYTITDPDSGLPLVVFDTTGGTTAPPPHAPSLLVTRNALVVRKSPTEIQTSDLSHVQFFQLDSARVQGWLQNFAAWYWLAYPLLTILSWVWRLILMLIFAALGLAMASGIGAPLTYAGLLRLSAIAMTPVILIDTLLVLAPGLNLGCAWTIGGLALDLIVLFLAVRANAPATPPAWGGPSEFPVAPPQPWPPVPPT